MALPTIGRAALREWLLLLGFALILGAALWTVALPELSKEPEGEANSARDGGVPDQ